MASKINPFTGDLQQISDGSSDTDLTIDGTTLLIDNGILKANLLSDDAINIQIDEIRARDIDGLKLNDDAGNGILIQDGGNVRIGDVAEVPLTTLHILDSSPTIRLSSGGTGNTGGFEISLGSVVDFKGLGNNDYVFSTNNAEKMRITAGGSVGIGTSTPILNLHVITGGGISDLGSTPSDRGIAITGNVSGQSRLYFEDRGSPTGERVFGFFNDGGLFKFTALNNTASSFTHQFLLTLKHNTGDIGIGLSPTLGKLHIKQTSDTVTGGVTVEGTGGGTGRSYINGSDEYVIQKGTNNNQLVLDGSGNIGIDTTPTKGRLHLLQESNSNSKGIVVEGINSDTGRMYINTGDDFVLQKGGNTNQIVLEGDGSVRFASKNVDCSSTSGALIPNRLTTTQRDALTPTNGMIIYNTTLNKFQGRENGAWANLI